MGSSAGSRKRPLRTSLVMVAFLLAAWPAPAQQATEEATSATEEPAAQPAPTPPQPVPPAEIANRATEAVNRLRESRRLTTPTQEVQAIAQALPEEIAAIEELRASSVQQDLAEAPRKLLDEARQRWERHESILKRWSEELDRRSREVQDSRDTVARLGAVWRLTAEAPETAELPPAVRQQIDAVLQEIDATAAGLRQRQEVLLTLQNQISELRIAISETLEQVDAQLVSRQDDLLAATAPPLWRPAAWTSVGPSVRADVVDTFERTVEGMQRFGRDFQERIALHLAVFLVLAVAIKLLGRRTEGDPEAAAEIEEARSVLRRPWAASALVTTLILSTMYRDAPVVVHSLIPILALPFAAWLVPGLVPPARRRLVGVVLVLSLLINLQELVVEQGMLRQLSLAFIAGAGIAGLATLRRRVRAEEPLVWPGITRTVLAVGWPVLIVVLLAAVLGYLSLAELLASALIEAGFVAYVLLAVARALDALVFLLLRTPPARRINSIRLHSPMIRRSAASFVRLLAFLMWFWIIMRQLQLRERILDSLGDWFTRSWQVGSLGISVGSVLLFVLVIWFSLFLSRIVRAVLADDVLPRADLGRGRSHMISMLVNYTIIGLGFLLALGAAGIEVSQFALIGGALGVGIGFGLQNVVSNFVSGLILVFERPVQVGDVVEVGPLMGTVRRIGIRSSTVRTFDEAEVIVPNSDLISSHVVNWTLSDQLRRMEVKVGVAYGTDPVQVQEILVAVAKAHEKVLDYPVPYALFRGFGDSSLDFVVRFWTSDFSEWIHIASQVTVGINAALKEAGITIPFPQRDLHIYAVDPPAPIPDGGRVDLPDGERAEERSGPPQAGNA